MSESKEARSEPERVRQRHNIRARRETGGRARVLHATAARRKRERDLARRDEAAWVKKAAGKRKKEGEGEREVCIRYKI